MNEVICFFKDILMLSKDDRLYVGLTRLNKDLKKPKTQTIKTKRKNRKDIKISDLMRRSN